MRFDSLDELKTAFAAWRRRKKHAREPMPEELLARARRAAQKHGVRAVVRVTRVERARLFRATGARGKAPGAARTQGKAVPRPMPAFSRLEVGAPSAPSPRPIAEVWTGSGVTLRVFEPTPEMMGLLSAVCGFGGVR
ncbi:MAG: hypothetical protein KJ698_13995 [Actinobacteria bacterium]|nr:hypothetical protein [Actinomycetota bacterium]